jgi:ribosomal protein L27
MQGCDDTLFAIIPGSVKFYQGFKGRKFVKIEGA